MQVKNLRIRLDKSLQPASYQACLNQAKDLLFKSAMDLTNELLSQGKLKDLCVETRDDITRTQHVSKGRLGSEGNLALFGITELPVISGDTRLAYLVLTECHEGQYKVNHMKASDALP